jgi:hypothetical protein
MSRFNWLSKFHLCNDDEDLTECDDQGPEEGYATYEEAKRELDNAVKMSQEAWKSSCDKGDRSSHYGQVYIMKNGCWEPFFKSELLEMQPVENKRKQPEPTQAVEVLHWRDAAAVLADLKVVGCDLLPNKFGWVLKRLIAGKRFLVQGPTCTVVFAPQYQDPTKFKTNPQAPDPNRKRDKWNCTLKTTDIEFAKFINSQLKKATLEHMFECRAQWNGTQYESPAELTATLPNPVEIDQVTGVMTFGCDLTAAKDATRPDLVLKDYETEEPLGEDIMIGQHSEIVPILDLSDVFLGKQAKSKQWIKMPTAFVRDIVTDTRVDAKSIKLAKRE